MPPQVRARNSEFHEINTISSKIDSPSQIIEIDGPLADFRDQLRKHGLLLNLNTDGIVVYADD